MEKIGIVEFQEEHQPWFERLNRSWIERYFKMEPIDFEVLQYPGKHIISKGGSILMVTVDDAIVGTVALKYSAPGIYEFTKMAVNEKFQGRKIGETLALAAIRKAEQLGGTKIILYSNTILEPAIRLYRKLGFREVPLDGPYERSNIKMELTLGIMNDRIPWFERKFSFGLVPEMLPLILERLEGTVSRMEHKVSAVNDSVLSEKFDGKWSVKQNIGHLAEVDKVNNGRIDEILRGVEVMAPAVFEPQDYNPWPIARVIAFFNDARQSNIRKYAALSTGERKLTSIHPRLKVKMNPVDLAFFDAEHDDHHLLKISDIIRLRQ